MFLVQCTFLLNSDLCFLVWTVMSPPVPQPNDSIQLYTHLTKLHSHKSNRPIIISSHLATAETGLVSSKQVSPVKDILDLNKDEMNSESPVITVLVYCLFMALSSATQKMLFFNHPVRPFSSAYPASGRRSSSLSSMGVRTILKGGVGGSHWW